MKTQSAGLAAHRAGGSTTLCFCWKITRQDGQVFTYTNLDRDLTFEGLTYYAAQGFDASAVQAVADLSVANLELSGPLVMASIDEESVLAGLWDNAEVEVFEVNYRDLSMGKMIVSKGSLGDINTTRNQFKAEQRGIEQKLQQAIGRFYSAACDATFGDSRCKINAAAWTDSGTVTSATNRRTFSASGLPGTSDLFGGGVLTWTSGDNNTYRMEVQTYSGGNFVLALNMPNNIQPGDTFTVVAGCRKRRDEDCDGKFNNVINFRGFPDIPGNNKIIGNGGFRT